MNVIEGRVDLLFLLINLDDSLRRRFFTTDRTSNFDQRSFDSNDHRHRSFFLQILSYRSNIER